MIPKHLANSHIDDLMFSVVDTETTGMNSRNNKIIDIGIVKVKKSEIVDEWETLISPDQEIPYWITWYTKLKSEHFVNEKVFSEYADFIYKFLEKSVFVGHNVGFDYSFVTQEFSKLDVKIEMPKLCTVLLGKKLLPELKSFNLDTLSHHFGIKIDQRHRALPDAKATALLFIELIKLAKTKYNVKTYSDLFKLQYIKNQNPQINESVMYIFRQQG